MMRTVLVYRTNVPNSVNLTLAQPFSNNAILLNNNIGLRATLIGAVREQLAIPYSAIRYSLLRYSQLPTACT